MPSERRGPVARWGSVLRRICGMPDYEAFVAHLSEHHPGTPAPSVREYYAQFVAARYGDSPTRCC
jgi:uncharacterized short protein YbdD (DUF466 family)